MTIIDRKIKYIVLLSQQMLYVCMSVGALHVYMYIFIGNCRKRSFFAASVSDRYS